MFRSIRDALLTFLGAGLLLQAACTCGSGPYEEEFDADRPEPLAAVAFKESEKGDPKIIGCSDGQREGFADLKAHPRVAGCMAKWAKAKSLRDPPTGKACGDDGEQCATPADACAEGWHVCGAKGDPQDIRDRANAKQCHNAGPGRFNAALSHSPTDEIKPCPKIGPSTKLPCVQAGLGSEPVCCGSDCKYGKCRDGVWQKKTKISRGTTEGCGAVTAARNGGVMCCFDGDGNPDLAGAPADAEAPAAEAGEAAEAAAPAVGEEEAEAKADEGKADDKKADEGKAEDKKAADKDAALK